MAAKISTSTMHRAAPLGVAYWAKRTFRYGQQQLDRGQIFKLQELPNDRLLVDLGYVAVAEDARTFFACRVCGLQFLDSSMRDGHGKFRHDTRTFVPPPAPARQPGESTDAYQNRLDEWALAAGRMSEHAEEQVTRRDDEVAPLDLTKTTASRT